MRLFYTLSIFVSIVIITFLIWGDFFTAMFTTEGTISFLSNYGQWAWVAAIILLILDIVLPLPGTLIMSVLGYLYGPIVGGLLSLAGNFLSGLLAYFLCKKLGQVAAKYMMSAQSISEGQDLFNKKGGWIVALSRWLPILPEAIACTAGLHQMKTSHFAFSLLCGSLPLAFAFAYVGYIGQEEPFAAVVISAILPAIIWYVAHKRLKQYTI